jgi:hypothetical protein
MQRMEVTCAIRLIYTSLGAKGLILPGSTHPLTEMSTSGISWGGGRKSGLCLGLTTLSLSCTNCLDILGVSTS